MEHEDNIFSRIAKFDDAALIKFVADLHPSEATSLLKQADQAFVARLLSKLPIELLVKVLASADKASLQKVLIHAHPAHLTRFVSSTTTGLFNKLLEASPTRRQREKLIAALPRNRRDAVLRRLSASSERDQLPELKTQPNRPDETAINDEMLRMLENEKQEIESRYNERLREIELERQVLRTRETELLARLARLEESQSKQVQQRIEAKVPEYVAAAVQLLEARETLYRKKSSLWNLQASAVLFVAICCATLLSLYGIHYGPPVTDLSWQALIFVSFKGVLVLGVLGLWAKHAYTISNAYMHEAIKRSDRAHAINFGKLYLEVYGTAVERKELIDIFENWNINSDSAFAKSNPSGFESGLLERALDLLKASRSGKDAA